MDLSIKLPKIENEVRARNVGVDENGGGRCRRGHTIGML